MRLKKLEVHNFRKMKDTTIVFGKYLTCISGHNAVGKSTILGILANSSELKKTTGATVHGNSFRADLREIMKFSDKFDESGSNKCTLFFNDLPEKSEESYVSTLSFRATWQSETPSKSSGNSKKRYRLIPMKTKERNTERKLQWPTLYLGLSRLYPVGEVSDQNVSSDNTVKLTQEEKDFLFEGHRSILSSSDIYKESRSLKIKNTKKTGFGIETEDYDALANSSGQDNLGQILLALVSFKRLQLKMGDKWNGGLLLIDEVDATLHPVAQNRLIDFLYDFAKDNKMQIIFTTHSLSLLEHIDSIYRTIHPYIGERTTNQLSVETNYLTLAFRKLMNYRNPDIQEIKKDLLNTYIGEDNEIKIYSEDEEARWFFDKLLSYFDNENYIEYRSNTFKHVSINMGSQQLLKLLSEDFEYFSKHIILLDGDVKVEEINKVIVGKTPIEFQEHSKLYNILKLPGNDSPEKVLWEYANDIPEDHNFYIHSMGLSFNKRSFTSEGPFSEKYDQCSRNRDKFKEWFKKNQYILDYLIQYWIKDNPRIINQFLNDLKNVHDYVAGRNYIDQEMIIKTTGHQNNYAKIDKKEPTGQTS